MYSPLYYHVHSLYSPCTPCTRHALPVLTHVFIFAASAVQSMRGCQRIPFTYFFAYFKSRRRYQRFGASDRDPGSNSFAMVARQTFTTRRAASMKYGCPTCTHSPVWVWVQTHPLSGLDLGGGAGLLPHPSRAGRSPTQGEQACSPRP